MLTSRGVTMAGPGPTAGASAARRPWEADAQQAPQETPAELKKAARDFEALLAQELLKGLHATVPQSGLMGGGINAEIYQSMVDEGLAKVIADRGALGLGDLLVRQLGKHLAGKAYATSPSSSPIGGTMIHTEAIPPSEGAKKES